MDEIAGWIAPAATMIAAMMTASNLGARVTGWGFVVFTVGSISWSIVAMLTDQQNLLLTNLFLTLVNMVGVWRWLGRQARFEEGGLNAARHSNAARVPSLFSADRMIGMPVTDCEGERLGVIVDAMIHCERTDIAYAVISDGGVAGIGETLRALPPDELTFSSEEVVASITAERFRALPAFEADDWPAAVS